MSQVINYSRFHLIGRKIVCIGRNYIEHAKELGNAVPTEPLIFMKPPSSYITQEAEIIIPIGCKSLHHEIELGVVIGKGGKNICENEAMNHIAGYVLALDMTARDLQNAAKSKGLPWEMAKGFDTSCPVSDFIPKDKIQDPHNVQLWCKVNGVTKQNGNTKDMIFNVPSLISFISKHFKLESCDVILTGTPSGVGPVVAGDIIEGGILEQGNKNDLVKISFKVKNNI